MMAPINELKKKMVPRCFMSNEIFYFIQRPRDRQKGRKEREKRKKKGGTGDNRKVEYRRRKGSFHLMLSAPLAPSCLTW